MKVLITGATGLVGAHSALALLQGGHAVRLLVRNADAARRYFAALGFEVTDLVTADVRDAAKVRQALTGCDAVLHAAALVSVDPRRADEILANNRAATESVIGAACELGIGNIVYVSSLEVFTQRGRASVDESAPLGDSRVAYSRSKRDGEQYVRALQEQGKPIQITYPSAVFGPDDPKLSAANQGLSALLAAVPLTSTGMQFVDARDLGLAHRWLLEHPVRRDAAAARYIVGGRYLPWPELHARLAALTGRRILAPRVPGAVLRGLGHAVDAARAIVPFNTQLSADAMAVATQWTPADSTRFTTTSGLSFRAPEATLTDTIRWLARAGHVPAKLAGTLAVH